MIYVNGEKIEVKHFPDNTQMLLDLNVDDVLHVSFRPDVKFINFKWIYESDEELVTLMYLVNHYRSIMPAPLKNVAVFRLIMLYIPNARMDRTKSKSEVFTLKYFCDFINSLHFDEVIVLDPHSNVSTALLNNLIIENVSEYIKYAIDDIEGVGIDGGERYGGTSIIYFPDEGAMKRYKDLKVFGERRLIYGSKNRDWKTGKILGLTIHSQEGTDLTEFGDKPLTNSVMLMIDDIISYGGTLAYSADSLKNLGASAIYAYASHTENSVLDEENGTFIKRLNNGTVDGLFTTPSIYRGDHPKITVLNEL